MDEIIVETTENGNEEMKVGDKYVNGELQATTYLVPKDQAWMRYLLEQQKKSLDKINGKLAFIVAIIIIGIILSLLRGCGVF